MRSSHLFDEIAANELFDDEWRYGQNRIDTSASSQIENYRPTSTECCVIDYFESIFLCGKSIFINDQVSFTCFS